MPTRCQSLTRCGVLVAFAVACAPATGSPSASAVPAMSFDEALVSDSTAFAPVRGFRALAEPEWSHGAASVSGKPLPGSSWRISNDCVVRFDSAADALAASESPPLPTHRLDGDACHGHLGFWQQAAPGGRLFWWTGLAGGWSAEYYADITDTTMVARRYALRTDDSRVWRVERGTMTVVRGFRVPEPVATSAKRSAAFDVTRALRALGDPDWTTRPGAGPARVVAGTRWSDASAGPGCVLVFAVDVVARAAAAQRLTRSLQSTGCGGLRGSWQQAGKRVFWRVNYDSLSAGETYADVVSDTLMRARYFDLTRPSSRAAWQATWVPGQSRVLHRVKR